MMMQFNSALQVPIIMPGGWQKEYTVLKSICSVDNSNLRHMNYRVFVVSVFSFFSCVKVWLRAPNSSNAPYNDLCLLQTLESNGAIDKQIADIVIKKMRGHLWYLSKDLIGLKLFSDFVPNSEKEAMIATLKIPQMKTDLRRVDSKLVTYFQEKTLSDFITQRSVHCA